jgi:nucleotide-binding universal stress UspA family protein
MQKIERILVPVDLSARARAALEHAIALAAPLDATVDVLFVFRLVDYVSAEVIAAAGAGAFFDYSTHAARRELLDFMQTVDSGDVKLRARLEQGTPAETIIEIARAEHYDLVVLGAPSHSGWWGMLLGSVSHEVARRVTCPILTVRPPPVPDLTEQLTS